MLTKLIQFVKDNYKIVILFLLGFLISLLSFALGYLSAQYQIRETIRIENAP